MGKSKARLEKDDAEKAFVTRDELEQFSLDIQKKFNDFALIRLKRIYNF
jgi:hypothetical protein